MPTLPKTRFRQAGRKRRSAIVTACEQASTQRAVCLPRNPARSRQLLPRNHQRCRFRHRSAQKSEIRGRPLISTSAQNKSEISLLDLSTPTCREPKHESLHETPYSGLEPRPPPSRLFGVALSSVLGNKRGIVGAGGRKKVLTCLVFLPTERRDLLQCEGDKGQRGRARGVSRCVAHRR